MFGNLISTDLVAAPPPVLIDKLTDLLKFNRKPIFGIVSDLKFSTSSNPIWRQIWNNRHRSLNSTKNSYLALDDMATNGDVLILSNIYEVTTIERMYCMREPSVNMFYKGSQKIDQVSEARILNSNISNYLRTSINRAHVATEMYGIRQKIDGDFAEVFLGQSTEVDRCLETNGYKLNQMVSVTPIGLDNVRYLVMTMLMALILGTICIVHEFLTRYRRTIVRSLRRALKLIKRFIIRLIMLMI